LFLAFAREPAGNLPPEDAFLALYAPTGKTWSSIVDASQGVDTKVFPENAEARTQQESSDDEPSLFRGLSRVAWRPAFPQAQANARANHDQGPDRYENQFEHRLRPVLPVVVDTTLAYNTN
jgi:hypothetical protein